MTSPHGILILPPDTGKAITGLCDWDVLANAYRATTSHPEALSGFGYYPHPDIPDTGWQTSFNSLESPTEDTDLVVRQLTLTGLSRQLPNHTFTAHGFPYPNEDRYVRHPDKLVVREDDRAVLWLQLADLLDSIKVIKESEGKLSVLADYDMGDYSDRRFEISTIEHPIIDDSSKMWTRLKKTCRGLINLAGEDLEPPVQLA